MKKIQHCRLCTIILSHTRPEQRPAVYGSGDICQWCYDHYGRDYQLPKVDHAQSRNMKEEVLKVEILEYLNLLSDGAEVREVARRYGCRVNTISYRLCNIAPVLFGEQVVNKKAKTERVTDAGYQLLKEYGYHVKTNLPVK